jgi:hypothetical protein
MFLWPSPPTLTIVIKMFKFCVLFKPFALGLVHDSNNIYFSFLNNMHASTEINILDMTSWLNYLEKKTC